MSDLNILHGCCTLQLTRGLNTLVDEMDWLELSKKTWCAVEAKNGFYAATHRKRDRRTIRFYLHRDILEKKSGKIPGRHHTDHRNRDTLDNRRDNVRLATVSQNRSNSAKKLWRGGKSSEYKGVSFHKATGKWRAVIVKGGKQREIGRFASEIDAAKAYNRAAIEAHGEFARINEGI